jgi:hypothetical protein
VFAAMRPSQMEFRHFSEREARMLSIARQEIINRPGLMLEEKQIIIAQLEAVACAKVRCAQGVPDADELKQHLLLIQKLGDQLIQQGLDITTMLAELEIDTVIRRGAGQARRGYRGDKHAFGYTSDDWLSDMSLVNDELITRGGGVVRSVGGAVSAGSGIIMTGTGAASCGVTFGAGCAVAVVAGVPLTALGAMEMNAGWQTMTGDYVSAHGQRVLDSFSTETHQGHFSVLESMTERAAIFSAEMLSGRIGGKYFVDTVARSRAVGVDDVVIDGAGGVPDLARARSELRIIDTSDLTAAQKGALGEARAPLIFQRAGYQELPARLPSNNGFDGVFIKYDADGVTPIDIIINESKFTSTGRVSLSNTNMGRQMSPEWIDANIQKMMNSSNQDVVETGFMLDAYRNIVRTKFNVLNPQGVNRWNLVESPK